MERRARLAPEQKPGVRFRCNSCRTGISGDGSPDEASGSTNTDGGALPYNGRR